MGSRHAHAKTGAKLKPIEFKRLTPFHRCHHLKQMHIIAREHQQGVWRLLLPSKGWNNQILGKIEASAMASVSMDPRKETHRSSQLNKCVRMRKDKRPQSISQTLQAISR